MQNAEGHLLLSACFRGLFVAGTLLGVAAVLGGVFVVQRDMDGEAGALALLTFHLHPAAVAVDDLLHHGQAHAKAAALAVATGVGAPEAREHHAGLFLSKADAGVAHGEAMMSPFCTDTVMWPPSGV